MSNKNKEVKVEKKDIPLGGDYALGENDKPVVRFEDRTGRKAKPSK